MQGGHLATITSEGEERFIEQMLKNEYYYIKEGICWLGATDEKKEGTWEWVTGEEFSYSNWWLYNPDNRDHGVYGSENWLVIRRQHWTGDGKITVKFTWEDFAEVVCEGYNDVIKCKTGFICEWD